MADDVQMINKTENNCMRLLQEIKSEFITH